MSRLNDLDNEETLIAPLYVLQFVTLTYGSYVHTRRREQSEKNSPERKSLLHADDNSV